MAQNLRCLLSVASVSMLALSLAYSDADARRSRSLVTEPSIQVNYRALEVLRNTVQREQNAASIAAKQIPAVSLPVAEPVVELPIVELPVVDIPENSEPVVEKNPPEEKVKPTRKPINIVNEGENTDRPKPQNKPKPHISAPVTEKKPQVPTSIDVSPSLALPELDADLSSTNPVTPPSFKEDTMPAPEDVPFVIPEVSDPDDQPEVVVDSSVLKSKNSDKKIDPQAPTEKAPSFEEPEFDGECSTENGCISNAEDDSSESKLPVAEPVKPLVEPVLEPVLEPVNPAPPLTTLPAEKAEGDERTQALPTPIKKDEKADNLEQKPVPDIQPVVEPKQEEKSKPEPDVVDIKEKPEKSGGLLGEFKGLITKNEPEIEDSNSNKKQTEKPEAPELPSLPKSDAQDDYPELGVLPDKPEVKGAPELPPLPQMDVEMEQISTLPPADSKSNSELKKQPELAALPDLPTDTVESQPPKAETSEVKETLRVDYAEKQSDVSDAQQAKLEAVAKQLNVHSEKRLRIMAYASGTADQSSTARRVSLARGLALRAFFIERGVHSYRIEVRPKGNQGKNNADYAEIIVE